MNRKKRGLKISVYIYQCLKIRVCIYYTQGINHRRPLHNLGLIIKPRQEGRSTRASRVTTPGEEKSCRNRVKSTRTQIVLTMHRFIWNQMDTVRLLFQINWKIVNII